MRNVKQRIAGRGDGQQRVPFPGTPATSFEDSGSATRPRFRFNRLFVKVPIVRRIPFVVTNFIHADEKPLLTFTQVDKRDDRIAIKVLVLLTRLAPIERASEICIKRTPSSAIVVYGAVDLVGP